MYAGRTSPTGGDRLFPRRPCPGTAGPASSLSEDGTESAPLELALRPDVVTDVDDASGRWQHERGRVCHHGTDVGVYASTSHLVATGTEPQDQATLTLTIFFLVTTPPETITVHGAHDAGSDRGTGTVSAASAGHAGRVGHSFRRAGDIVTIE